MKTYTAEELKMILDKHKKWLDDEEGGEQANLSSADLRWADLSWANLRWADLRWADLSWANLSWADLSSANLRSADLRWANLNSADLSSANLRWANLNSADLSWANLNSADLSSANLRSADLRWAKTFKRYIVISCIGSRKDSTIYCFDDDIVWCGCFKGTLDEFADKVNKTYKADNVFWKEYMGAINYIKSLKEDK